MPDRDAPHDVPAAHPKRSPRTTPRAMSSSGAGHPLRSRGLTFVTHEVEAKGPFGLPTWDKMLQRAGLKRQEQVD